jgi:hypothetical protein
VILLAFVSCWKNSFCKEKEDGLLFSLLLGLGVWLALSVSFLFLHFGRYLEAWCPHQRSNPINLEFKKEQKLTFLLEILLVYLVSDTSFGESIKHLQ